jgi:hypothetical protein
MKVKVGKKGLDWYADNGEEIHWAESWHDAMQSAWGLVMFP